MNCCKCHQVKDLGYSFGKHGPDRVRWIEKNSAGSVRFRRIQTVTSTQGGEG